MIIDVILISYKQERYIQQALESILCQRILSDWQIHLIIADDNSTDQTMSIIQSTIAIWQKNGVNNSQIQIDVLDGSINLGMHRNYQRAFAACKGKYVAVLEGDDYWVSPEHLTQQVSFLEEHLECAMSMNNIMLLDDSSNIYTLHRTMNDSYEYVDLHMQIAHGNQLGNLSACVFRTELISLIPQRVHDMGFADWFLGIWMAQYGLIGILKQVTSVYRKNENGLWTKMSKEEQSESLVKYINAYDEVLEHKYSAYFEEYRSELKKTRSLSHKNKFRAYVPPLVIAILRGILPPAIYKKVKSVL